MKRLLLALEACLLLAPGLAMAQAPDPEAHYQELLTTVKAATGPVDWAALRYAYADLPSFMGSGDDDDRAAMFKALQASDWPAVEAAARRVIDAMYVDGAAHFMLGVALDKQGKPDGARERAIGTGLLESIETGDGLSYDTAFTVITVAEEYDLMSYIGVSLDTQALSQHDGHTFDVMTTKDDSGKTAVYYFNIDREWAAENRMFSGLGLDDKSQ